MELRDKNANKNNLDDLIAVFKNGVQKFDEKINQNKEIKHYSLDNDEVINNLKSSISRFKKEIMIAVYTAGYPLEDFKEEYLQFVDSLLPIWYSNSGYDEMLWALSIGILLEIDEATFDKLVDLVKKDNPEDYLIDYLIQSRHPDWPIRINYNFPQPYGFTRKIIEEEDSEKALSLLKEYVTKKWYPGHRDTGWYDLHKRNIKSFYGYWSFESGALCKLKGLDYKELEGLSYFPYDLVANGAEA